MKRIIVPLFVMLIVRESAGSTPNLRFASPLQSLTIWDEQVESATPRARFLPKFRAGLKAEVQSRKALKVRNEQALVKLEQRGGDWAKNAAALERSQRREEDRLCEVAYDEAIKSFTSQQKESLKRAGRSKSQYQFVGIINSASSTSKPVTWYARKKPANGNWSLRLIHVNRDAIIKDLFNRRKVDVFARYKNTGESDEGTNQLIVKADYIVKERSWRTLWNFSPKHFFTDSSGMYWRERRLPSGLYSDGNMVYETSYRYRDGRNGMRRLSTFEQFINSKTVNPALKEKAVSTLQKSAPDVVLEG